MKTDQPTEQENAILKPLSELSEIEKALTDLEGEISFRRVRTLGQIAPANIDEVATLGHRLDGIDFVKQALQVTKAALESRLAWSQTKSA